MQERISGFQQHHDELLQIMHPLHHPLYPDLGLHPRGGYPQPSRLGLPIACSME